MRKAKNHKWMHSHDWQPPYYFSPWILTEVVCMNEYDSDFCQTTLWGHPQWLIELISALLILCHLLHLKKFSSIHGLRQQLNTFVLKIFLQVCHARKLAVILSLPGYVSPTGRQDGHRNGNWLYNPELFLRGWECGDGREIQWSSQTHNNLREERATLKE